MRAFVKFKREWAENWASDDANNYGARDFVVSVLADYYEQSMPNNLKEFKEWLVNEKGYDEDDVQDYTKDLEETANYE